MGNEINEQKQIFGEIPTQLLRRDTKMKEMKKEDTGISYSPAIKLEWTILLLSQKNQIQIGVIQTPQKRKKKKVVPSAGDVTTTILWQLLIVLLIDFLRERHAPSMPLIALAYSLKKLNLDIAQNGETCPVDYKYPRKNVLRFFRIRIYHHDISIFTDW